MDASRREQMKFSMSIITSVLVSAIALILIAGNWLPPLVNLLLIPGIAYGFSVIMSIINQYVICNKVTLGTVLLGDSLVLLTNGLLGLLLFAEQIPFLKDIFGDYPPRNPISGLPYTPDSAEYVEGMKTQNHYKIQLLSGIVKAVVPVYLDESIKQGIVYLYWTFWMTLLPLYFTMGVQALC